MRFLVLAQIVACSLCVGGAAFAGSAAVADTADTARAATDVRKVKPARPRRLFFGGGVSFTVGTTTRISVSPLVGYQVSRTFSVGTQLSYDYLRQRVEGREYSLRSLGASTFGRMHFGQLYAHVEPAVYDQEVVTSGYHTSRSTVPYLFIGGGAFQSIAPGLRAFVQVTFDLLGDPDSPYRRGESFVTTGIAVGP